jgi:site-specific recombinase XerD
MAGRVTGTDALLRSFARSLRARNRSPKTVSSYLEAARLLSEHAHDRGLLVLTRSDIEEFLADQLERHRPTTAAVRFRSLQQFYRWAVEEELIETTPMAGLSPPTIPEQPVPVLDEAQLARLLGCMSSRSFDDRRDTAIVRLFLDTGMRLSEMAGLALSDIDLDADVALVLGKGRRPRACPFGDKTGQAIERYLRERSKHRLAKSGQLWIWRSRRYDRQRHRPDASTPGQAGWSRSPPPAHVPSHIRSSVAGRRWTRTRSHASCRLAKQRDARSIRSQRR